MTTPVTFILGPATELHAKFVAVASVIAHSTLHPGDVVDVTVPGEMAVTRRVELVKTLAFDQKLGTD